MRLRSQPARDLAWLALGADYLSPEARLCAGRLARLTLPEREEAARIATELDELAPEDWLGPLPAGLPLGRYCERLLLQWLRRSRTIELVASHEALREDGRTVGEIDALVRRHTLAAGTREQHWEIAVAYFLHVGPGLDGWVGPDMRDTLSGKAMRIFGHQLTLGERASFRERFGDGWLPRAFIRGWYFLELAAQGEAPAPPEPGTVNPAAAHGWWCDDRAESLAGLADRWPVHHWRALPRRRWLSAACDPLPVPLARCAPADALAAGRRAVGPGAVLLAGMRLEAAGYRETVRVFVVPGELADIARARARAGTQRPRWPGMRFA